MRLAYILYFIEGVSPTGADLTAADAMSAKVVFRNARAVPAEGSLEICDGVAGAVPPSYAAAYPAAEDAIATKKAARDLLNATVGDTAPPALPGEGTPAAPLTALAEAGGKDGDVSTVTGDGDSAPVVAAAKTAPGWSKA